MSKRFFWFWCIVLLSLLLLTYSGKFIYWTGIGEFKVQPKQQSYNSISSRSYLSEITPITRAEQLWQNCEKLGLRMSEIKELPYRRWSTTMLLLSEKYKLITCSVFKSGSTHWRKIFQVLQHHHDNLNFTYIQTKDKMLMEVRHLEMEEAMEALRSFTKIMVFRDPLERLLSFYRDKLTKRSNGYRPKMYILGAKIHHYFHPVYVKPERPVGVYAMYEPSFEDVIKYILIPNVHGKLPYWEPMHWNNYTRCCHPCEVHYSHVLDMNQMTYEANEIFAQLNVPSKVRFPEAYTNRSEAQNKELFGQYYSSIPPELYRKICDYYETDYNLFGLECPTYPGQLNVSSET